MTCSRRDFLADCARLALGVSIGGAIPDLLAAAEAPAGGRTPAQACIILHMQGGMSHLDTLDPKREKAVAGPLVPIPTVVDGVFLGPYLPRLARRLDQCAVIRSVSSNQGAHEQGQYLVRTGYLQRGGTIHPTLGAWDVHLRGRRNPTLPPYVSINRPGNHPGAGFLPADCQPLPVGNPSAGLPFATRPKGVSAAAEERRRALLKTIDDGFLAAQPSTVAAASRHLYDQAVTLMASKDLEAFDLAREPASVRTAYGEDAFGSGCLLARRLVQHGVRQVEVALAGWDTHDDHFDRLEEPCAILDRGLSALLDDLTTQGLREQTLVVLMTEFGRTPTINGNQGRDHHPQAFSVLMAGGGVRGGQMHGATDARGQTVVEGRVEVPDVLATIAYGLGLPLDRTVPSPTGRPFTVADKGKPITTLFTG